MRLYLSSNSSRNRQLMSVLDGYGLSYDCVTVDQIDKSHVLELLRSSVDCFDLLTPSCLTYKRRWDMPLSRLIALILTNPNKTLRLPLIVEKDQVYPDVTSEELRTFLPRGVKKQCQHELRKLLTV